MGVALKTPIFLAAALVLGGCLGNPVIKAPPPVDGVVVDSGSEAKKVEVPAMTAAEAQVLQGLVDGVLASYASEIPLSSRQEVLMVIHHLQHHPQARLLVETALHNAENWRPQMLKQLKRDALPSDLLYIAQAESAFIDAALQGKGLAVGLWQMIPSTARHYGLRVNDLYDDRLDSFKSTDAAMRHLIDLYATFEDWELAITGFYAGAGIVERGLEITQAQDAWSLLKDPDGLPRECRAYLPYILAHIIISQDPQAFGFTAQVTESQLRDVQENYDKYYTNRYPFDLF